MLGRRQMPDIVNVWFPRKALGILRARQHESRRGPAIGSLQEQPVEHRLSIRGIGTQIRQVARKTRIGRSRPMNIRIDASIEGSNRARAEPALQIIERLASREAQHEIEIAQAITRQVRHGLAVSNARQRDRRVEVVKDLGGGS